MNNITTAQTIISLPLRRIFQGQMFVGAQENSLTSGQTRYYGIRTQDYPLHFGYEISFEHEATATLYKDSTNSVGTALTSKNVNTISTETMVTIIWVNPTVSVIGNVWTKQQWGDNTGTVYGNSNVGGRVEGYILKANSSYTLQLDEESASTNEYAITFGFFNHV